MGNTIFSDDGAGCLSVRAARARWQGTGVDFDEAMAGGLELLDRTVGYRAVLVVDAAVTGQAVPGERFLIDLAASANMPVAGAHGAHLSTAMALGRLMGFTMPVLQVLAIEAADVTLGESLTPAVAAAIEPAAAQIISLAQELLEAVTVHA